MDVTSKGRGMLLYYPTTNYIEKINFLNNLIFDFLNKNVHLLFQSLYNRNN